jgi:hypothetical protein
MATGNFEQAFIWLIGRHGYFAPWARLIPVRPRVYAPGRALLLFRPNTKEGISRSLGVLVRAGDRVMVDALQKAFLLARFGSRASQCCAWRAPQECQSEKQAPRELMILNYFELAKAVSRESPPDVNTIKNSAALRRRPAIITV